MRSHWRFWAVCDLKHLKSTSLQRHKSKIKNEFPGSPVAQDLEISLQEAQVQPSWGIKILHAYRHGQKNKSKHNI